MERRAAVESGTATQTEVETEFRLWLTEAETDDPHLAKIFGALRTHFPDQYHGLIRRAAEAWRKGRVKADGRQIGAQTMQDFVRANQKNIAFAPAGHLVRYASAQLRLMEVLREENVTVCARMAIGDRTPSEYVTPTMRAATADLAATMIHAARAGIDTPQSRETARISDADSVAYVRALKSQSLDSDVFDALLSEKLAYASPLIQCEAGLAHARAVASLDPETSARITALTLMP